MVLTEKEIGTEIIPQKKTEEINNKIDAAYLKDTPEMKIRGKFGDLLEEAGEFNSDTETMVVQGNSVKIVPPDKISKDSYLIPFTKSEFISNIKKRVKNLGDSLTWLVVFFSRVIKLKKVNVSFKKNGSK